MIDPENKNNILINYSITSQLCSMLLLAACLISGCVVTPSLPDDKDGPKIDGITTSSRVIAKSDCRPTSVTISAAVSGNLPVTRAALWYRVGEEQSYTSIAMNNDAGEMYSATIKALDVPGGEYGVFEFYITAEDKAGNQSKSKLDTSVQLLACVSN